MENLECLGCKNKLKLWVIERKDHDFIIYDTYSEAIVAAENESDARHIHPNGKVYTDEIDDTGTWTTYDNVKATLIGIAASNINRGVILSSFHDG
jgi:hypothetical protein